MADARRRWTDLEEAEKHAVLERLDRLAYWLDDRFRVPGTGLRVGLDGLVGLIPGVGDLATNAITAYMVYEAWRLGAPASILGRMVANLGIDTIVGLVPILGDVLDIGFKANRRNARLLRRHFGARLAAEPRSAAAAPSAAIRRI